MHQDSQDSVKYFPRTSEWPAWNFFQEEVSFLPHKHPSLPSLTQVGSKKLLRKLQASNSSSFALFPSSAFRRQSSLSVIRSSLLKRQLWTKCACFLQHKNSLFKTRLSFEEREQVHSFCYRCLNSKICWVESCDLWSSF